MPPENPYSPPRSEVNLPQQKVDVSPDILKKIKSAWVAGLISAGITLLFAVAGVQGFDLANLTDVFLIAGLSYGIYRRSRVCAVVMLVYFVSSKILIVSETGQVSGLFVALVFLYFYGQGVVGTFAYHKAVARARGPSDAE